MSQEEEKKDMMEDSEIDHIEGWIQAEEPETGKMYYANIFTKETTWDVPEAVQKYNEMQIQAKKSTKRFTSKNTWVAILDADSGDTYYYNKTTQETTWDKPEGFNLEVEPEEEKKKKKEIVFNKSNEGGNKNFMDKALTVVDDVKKDVSKLEQYSDIFRAATEYNFENTPESPDINFNFDRIDKETMEKIKEIDFWEFLKEYLPKRTSWGKEIPLKKIMTYTKKINKPITNLNKQIESLALQTFKNILSYVGERKSSKFEVKHAEKLVRIGMDAPGEIKDEIYFQVLKQMQNNPNKDFEIRLWKLFSVLSSSFSVSGSTVLYPILNYFYQIIKNKEQNQPEIVEYANFCFVRLYRAYNDETRREPPSLEEIKYLEAKKRIMVKIYFLTGSHTLVPVESYSTAKEVKDEIFKKLELTNQRLNYYSLYEVCYKKETTEERYIENNERILDLLSSWELERSMCKPDDQPPEFKMFLRIRVFYNLNISDIDTVTMYYTQMVYETINGRIPITEDDCVTLAALQLQHDLGDFKGSTDKILETVVNYIPLNLFENRTPQQWVDMILPSYSKIQGYKKIDTKVAYLEFLKKNPLYLSQQYYSRYINKENLDEPCIPDQTEIVVAIKPTGIIVCHPETLEVLKKSDGTPTEFPFSKILTWGLSTEFFVLVVGTQDDQEKLYFETSQGRSIDFLTSAYSNILMGKSIQQIASALSHSTQKTADSMKIATKKVLNRNATSFPRNRNKKNKK